MKDTYTTAEIFRNLTAAKAAIKNNPKNVRRGVFGNKALTLLSAIHALWEQVAIADCHSATFTHDELVYTVREICGRKWFNSKLLQAATGDIAEF